MPRFVVLEHDHPFLHWDFLLESAETLLTWRLHAPPETPGPILAHALPDHRMAYLDYEGPLSGNRGSVRRWDAGDYLWVEHSARRCVVHLSGQRLSGKAALQQIATPPGNPEDGDTWQFRLFRHTQPDPPQEQT